MLTTEPIVLASGSAARRQLLENAAIEVVVDPANVDEDAIRSALLADDHAMSGDDLAEVLARAKADRVTARHPGRLVLGADQTLSCADTLYAKPDTLAEAQTQLLALRGQTHRLHSAVVLARDSDVVWATVVSADVTFRDFSAAVVGRYLSHVGEAATHSVGCYHLEGAGLHLVEKVSGDYFTVLGLPMFELMGELRRLGVVAT